MSKSQAQQPPNANPLATNPANPAAPVSTPQFSNPTNSLFGAPAADGRAPPAEGFNADGSRVGYTFADQDAARFANGTYGGMQPPNPQNPQARSPTQPAPSATTVSGPPAGFLGLTSTGGPNDFWNDYDRLSQQPASSATLGGLAMPKPMDTNGRLLPREQITGTNTPYGPTVNSVPTGNVPSLVGGDALGTAMQDAQGAAYKNAQGYLDPQWKNSQDTLESKLANQGVMQNSEAWNKGMGEHARQKEFAYSQARSGAVQQGNAAQAQLFNQGLVANANQFGQNLEGGRFSNAVQQQLAAQGFTQQQIDNLEQQHRFDNSMSMRNQDINELLLQQQNPLNMMNALNSGGQVQQPQFTNTPGSNVNPTDILAAIQQQYGGQLNAFNSQTGSANSANAGIAAIIASLLCDRRLKTNVRKIGMHVVGVPLYEFDYLWGEHGVGVMADELEKIKPEAVHTLACGYRFVDYARL